MTHKTTPMKHTLNFLKEARTNYENEVKNLIILEKSLDSILNKFQQIHQVNDRYCETLRELIGIQIIEQKNKIKLFERQSQSHVDYIVSNIRMDITTRDYLRITNNNDTNHAKFVDGLSNCYLGLWQSFELIFCYEADKSVVEKKFKKLSKDLSYVAELLNLKMELILGTNAALGNKIKFSKISS